MATMVMALEMEMEMEMGPLIAPEEKGKGGFGTWYNQFHHLCLKDQFKHTHIWSDGN